MSGAIHVCTDHVFGDCQAGRKDHSMRVHNSAPDKESFACKDQAQGKTSYRHHKAERLEWRPVYEEGPCSPLVSRLALATAALAWHPFTCTLFPGRHLFVVISGVVRGEHGWNRCQDFRCTPKIHTFSWPALWLAPREPPQRHVQNAGGALRGSSMYDPLDVIHQRGRETISI